MRSCIPTFRKLGSIAKQLFFVYLRQVLEIMNFILKSVRRFKYLNKNVARRKYHILGIETSCDDTGLAVVNDRGDVLANVLDSQQKFHARYGGIIPPRAQDLHRAKIADVFERCLHEANLTPHQLDAIAVTTHPGLPLSLIVGLRFAKHIARLYNKPIVPVHHMQAHALQARMEQNIPYPFLCLLISGGHCQLTFVRDVDDFVLLGETLDDAPGEAFDKIARRLRLYIVPQYRNWNGGQAVEHAAQQAQQPDAYKFPLPLAQQRNCNFSFAGLKNNSFRAIRAAERQQGTPPDCLLSNYSDFCAGLLNAFSRHLRHRTQRAIEFCIANDFFGDGPRSLVVSGGVANNDTIFAHLTQLAEHYECRTFRPSKRYCSDNGVMIAWNGIEQWRAMGEQCLRWDYDEVHIRGKITLGTPLMREVEQAQIKCKWVRLIKEQSVNNS